MPIVQVAELHYFAGLLLADRHHVGNCDNLGPAAAVMSKPAKPSSEASVFQGIDRSSSAYKMLASMGWQEGDGLVRIFCPRTLGICD